MNYVTLRNQFVKLIEEMPPALREDPKYIADTLVDAVIRENWKETPRTYERRLEQMVGYR